MVKGDRLKIYSRRGPGVQIPSPALFTKVNATLICLILNILLNNFTNVIL